MNPSPDRGKECLPPKKREPRQGSTEHQVILDEFKPPVPLRSRSSAGGGEGSRDGGDNDRSLLNPNPHLLHTPPPLPAPAPALPLSLPWNLSYAPSVSLPLYPGQVSDRRSSGSPAWRDDPLLSPLTHHSRWFREGPLSLPPSPSSSSTSSFKTPFPAEPREIWSYFNSSRRDNSSSLFSPSSYSFGQHSLYSQDPSLVEARHRYLNKRPNGLDGQGSRTASTTRTQLPGEYVTESNRTRLDISPRSSHTNGGRRPHEDVSSRGGSHSGDSFLLDCQAQEAPEAHSSLQERHSIVKSSSNLLSTSPHSLGLVPRPGRGGLLDPLVETPAEAQIYYSLSSVCHPTPHVPAYPLFSPSGSSLYNLHREQGPRQHSLRTSPHSPLGLPNSHDQTHRERERERDRDQDRDREKVRQRDRDRTKEKEKEKEKEREREREREREKDHQHDKDHHDQRRQDSERDRGRESSPSHRYTSPPGLQPPPPALLPHFTKGSLIELASGRLKRVEELRTDDFLRSADTSPEFHLSTCTVLLISPSSAHGFSHLQVHLTDLNTQELLKVLVEYPFFVQDRGWSSCSPQRTSQLYGLPCRQLMEGDVCLALTPTPTQTHRTHNRTGSRHNRTHLSTRGSSSSHRGEMPPPPPPPPLPHHPPPTVPPPSHAAAKEPPVQQQPKTRKRRWSAPDSLPTTRTDAPGLQDLPHGSKLMKWQ